MAFPKKGVGWQKPVCLEFVIPGEPVPLTKVTDDIGPEVWSTYKQTKFNFVQNLKNQYEGQQFVDGPIELEVVFYMRATRVFKSNMIHYRQPSLFTLFNFVDHALQGVVYKKDYIISVVKLKKKYDSNYKTEITIRGL